MRSTSLLVALALVACGSSVVRPPPYRDGSTGGETSGSAGASGAGIVITNDGPPPDPQCGGTTVDVDVVPAQVYVVLDASGSMGDIVGTGTKTKLAASTSALVTLYREIGFRSRWAAALFPPDADDSCDPGREIFPPTLGDAKSFYDAGTTGPNAIAFAEAIDRTAGGGTPTAATLTKLHDKIVGLGPHTYVLLATDGGPDCNGALTCTAAKCLPNIEQDPGCPLEENCCDPSVNPAYSVGDCLDDDATVAATAALAADGVQTIVVGLPGSGPYADVLDRVATAGGTARASEPLYYRVDDLDALNALLDAIGSQVIVSCEITLAEPSAHPDLTNVYFDNVVVPEDPVDGWSFVDPSTVVLNGAGCAQLKSGSVAAVRVIVGCPTVVK